MGLDMYLTGDRFFQHHHPKREKKNKEGYGIKNERIDLGYWRKHPNLHGYIVEHFADGEDNCQPIELSAENIAQIIEAIKKRELPATSDFFFGESSGDDEELLADIDVFERALEWLKKPDPKVWRSVEYQASW